MSTPLSVGHIARTVILAGVFFMVATIDFVSFTHAAFGIERNYTPDITSETFWSRHRICVARISRVVNENTPSPKLVLEVTTPISGEFLQSSITIRSSEVWQPNRLLKGISAFEPGSAWLLFLPEECDLEKRKLPVVASPLKDESRDRLLQSVSKISSVRDANTKEVLQEGALDKDHRVASYCLRRLISSDVSGLSKALFTNLRGLQEHEQVQAEVRLLANQLANRIEGLPDQSSTEYLWLTSALQTSKYSESEQPRQFVVRMLEFRDRRIESARFLRQLAIDAEVPQATRMAAYGVFDSSKLHIYREPDESTEIVIDGCIEMLSDRDPFIRRAGSALLLKISKQLAHSAGSDAVVRHLDIIRMALRDALRVETENVSKVQIARDLADLASP